MSRFRVDILSTSLVISMSKRSPKKVKLVQTRTYNNTAGTQFFSDTSQTFTETISGSDVKDFRIKISKRQNATSAYSLRTMDEPTPFKDGSSCLINVGTVDKPDIRSLSGYIESASYLTYNEVLDSSLESQASSKVKNQIRSNSGNFNAMIPLAEVKELRGLVRQTAGLASNAIGALLALKRGNVRDAYARASDIWLGFSFGVKPLIGDTKAVAESLAAFFEQPPRNATFVGTAEQTARFSLADVYMHGADGVVYACKRTYDRTQKYKIIACLNLDIQAGNDYSLARQLGFAPENLLATAWELTPYSWVVDYFTNAGEFLEDMFFSPPGSTIYIVRDFQCIHDCRNQFTWKPTGGGQFGHSASHGESSGKCFYFSRASLTALPSTTFRLKSVDEIGKNAVNKLLNLASILGKR